MKLYCYVLYKLKQFVQATRTSRGLFRTMVNNTRGATQMFLLCCMSWPMAIVWLTVEYERSLGMDMRSGLAEAPAVGGGMLTFVLLAWGSYWTLSSTRYRAYAQEFASYKPYQRALGSIFVTLLLLLNLLLPFLLVELVLILFVHPLPSHAYHPA